MPSIKQKLWKGKIPLGGQASLYIIMNDYYYSLYIAINLREAFKKP